MKKIISIILALVMCFSTAAILASCGESAYDIAVKNGFEGTEIEWLESLKGEQGEKGDTGAKGEKGEKGDQGEKGDTGATGLQGPEGKPGEDGKNGTNGKNGKDGEDGEDGKNGTDGLPGQNGADGREPEFRVNEKNVLQWRYKGETEWKDLVDLGTTGNGGTTTPDTPETPDTPDEPAPEPIPGVDAALVASEFTVWAHWTEMPKLQLKAGDQVVDVVASMVTGTYDLTKAGTYEITIKYGEQSIPATIKVTTKAVEQTAFWYTTPATALKLVTTTPDGKATTTDLEYTGTITWGTPGVYPITVGTEAINISLENMIYYQNFDKVTGTDNASILAQLGWKDNLNHFENGQPTDKSVGVTYTNHKGYVFTEKWANTGISVTKAILAIDNGKLKIDNATNNPNGASANFKLTEDGYMYKELIAGKDYTMQYDVTFGDDCATWMWVSAVSGYKIDADRPFIAGYTTRIFAAGYANSVVSQLRSGKYVWNNNYDTTSYAAVTHDATGEVTGWGGNGNRRIVAEVFGGSATEETLAGKTVTVKVQYTYVAASEKNNDPCYEMTVYVKKEGGDFVLQYKTKFTARGWLNAIETQSGGYTGALALMLGGYPGSVKGASGQNIITDLSSCGQNAHDDQAPITKASAKGTVYIDNFAVWAGTGEMPTNTGFGAFANAPVMVPETPDAAE